MLSGKSKAFFPAQGYFPAMSYGERLKEALELAGKDRPALATALGISVQAIGQVIKGHTQAFTAENNAKAARFLKVDSYWLATGEGVAKLQGADWPFGLIDRERYESLEPERRGAIQNELEKLIAWHEGQQAIKRNGTSK